MGRSGGSAHRSGGGGGGRSHGGGGGTGHRGYHPSPSYHHHSPPPHHHHHSPTRHYFYGGGYGYRCSGNIGGLCAIPLFIIFLIILCIIVLASSPSVSVHTVIEKCEQVISCPSSLNGDIKFKTFGTEATAYLVKTTPTTSKSQQVNKSVEGETIPYGQYIFNSFNLVKGSTLAWDIQEVHSKSFTLYVIKGEDEYDKFKDYKDFHYEKTSRTSHSSSSFTPDVSDEYFVIVEADSWSVTIDNINFTIDFYKYDLTNYIKKSSQTTSFSVSDSYMPGACLIVDMPCDTDEADEIHIDYDEKRPTIFWVCVAFCVVFGLGMVGSIIVCIVCVIKKKKGTTGSTYQQVPSTTAQAPAYPTGYQQPTTPAAYQQPAPTAPPPTDPGMYQTAPVPYDASAPINAAPSTYAAAYDPSYGTVPTAY